MAEMIIEAEQLIKMNRQIKRKLYAEFDSKSSPIITNCNGREIKAIPVGLPQIVCVSEVDFPFGKNPNFPELHNKPFFFHFDGKVYALDRDETALLLGTDYRSGDQIGETNATLEACTSGPGLANAYVLGLDHLGVHKERNYAVVPVQYYKIDKKIHESLAIAARGKEGLERMINKLKVVGQNISLVH